MAYTSANMGLKIWNLITDLFSHSDLASNLATIDTHDHSNGKGVQINSPGIAPLAVTGSKIAGSTITDDKLAPATITGDKIAPSTITDANVAAATITGDKLVPATLTQANLALGAGFLQATTVVGSATIAAGQLVNYGGSAPATLTLPPPTTANQLLGIWVGTGSITPTAPLTVTTPSGAIVDKRAAVSSRALGQGDAFVLLTSFAGNWATIGGAWDSGWLAITPAANIAATTTPPTAARVIGDRAFLRGGLQYTAGSGFAFTMGTVPVIARPSNGFSFFVPPAPSSSALSGLGIQTDGTILSNLSPSQAQVSLDGITYFLT